MNKFGWSLSSKRRLVHPQPELSHTSEGDYDFENRKITNVEDPTEESDVSTKRYTDELAGKVREEIKFQARSMETINAFNSVLAERLEALEIDLQETFSKISTRLTDMDKKFGTIEDEIVKKLHIDLDMLESAIKNYTDTVIEKSNKAKRLELDSINSKLSNIEHDIQNIDTDIAAQYQRVLDSFKTITNQKIDDLSNDLGDVKGVLEDLLLSKKNSNPK